MTAALRTVLRGPLWLTGWCTAVSMRLLPALAPNCTDASRPESETVAHDWREIGSDAVQQYDQCVRCDRTEPWADHPYREPGP